MNNPLIGYDPKDIHSASEVFGKIHPMGKYPANVSDFLFHNQFSFNRSQHYFGFIKADLVKLDVKSSVSRVGVNAYAARRAAFRGAPR